MVLKMIIIFSLILITACSNGKLNSSNEKLNSSNEKHFSIKEIGLIPSETDTIAILVGRVDESGASTDETNLLVEEKRKISQVIDLLEDIIFEEVDKKYVEEQGYHKFSYVILFIEDIDSQKATNLWLLHDGKTIILPTWEEKYYINSDAESLYQELLNILEVTS